MLSAEVEQRRMYDTAALRDALEEQPCRNLPRMIAENEQRRQYDTTALRDLLSERPARVGPQMIAENEQRREYDTSALRDVLLAEQPPRIPTQMIAEQEQRREYDTSAVRTVLEDHPLDVEVAPSVQTASRPARPSRRLTSYFNAFQTSCSTSNDAPPSYLNATKRKRSSPTDLPGTEKLPSYSCSVSTEAKLFLCVESQSPLSDAVAGDWKEVYVTVRGTMLSVYRLKDGLAGKLIYTYTLQHAEVGLAPDVEHTVLVPQTRFAHFIPSAARRRAWQKDPDMFMPVEHTVLRLRAETEQILFSGPDEEGIHAFMFAVGSAIDIAQPIDDRSIPRQCTVPRRRRRQARSQRDPDLADPALLAEQERIFRTMYPGLAAERQAEIPEINNDRPMSPPVRDEDEVDMSLFREETAALSRMDSGSEVNNTSRPSIVRQTTASTVNTTFSNDLVYATSPDNFDMHGKWAPPHLRSPAQVQRYLRRCLPLLLADSPRASDVMICGGRRVKVNWRMELLEEFELRPPSYKSHDFPKSTNLVRTQSQSSAAESAAESSSPQESGSLLSNDQHDEITPVESGLENLQLTKVSSKTEKGAASPTSPTTAGNGEVKGQDPRETAQEMPVIAFCF